MYSLKSLLTATVIVASQLFAVNISSALEVGDKAPGFTLPGDKGKVSLSDLKGEVVMVNFWAEWCGPCRTELPHLDKLHSKYNKIGYTTLGVNVEEDSKKAKKLLKELGIEFPIAYDKTNKVSKLYNVEAMPTTIIIDRKGKVRHIHKGYKKGWEKKYKKEIKALLREK